MRRHLAIMRGILQATIAAFLFIFEAHCSGSDRVGVRILSPRSGQRVRSGENVQVIVRSELRPETGSGSSGDLSAMTLRLKFDSEDAQEMPAQEKISGEFAGLSDGLHDVIAELVDALGEVHESDFIRFEVGPPQPTVKISYPQNGSFVNDDPLTALFFHEDFRMGNGAAISVDLNGERVCWLQDSVSHHCDLHRVGAGVHKLEVMLLKPESERTGKLVIAAAHESTFTVRRPDVKIASPTPQSVVNVDRNFPVVSVKFSVLNLAPQAEVTVRVQVGSAHKVFTTTKADHFIVRIPINLDRVATSDGAGAVASVSLFDIDGDDVYDLLGDTAHAGVLDPNCECSDADCQACKSGLPAHRLLASSRAVFRIQATDDHASDPVVVWDQLGQERRIASQARSVRGEVEEEHALSWLAAGCTHVFMDVGTNSGESLHRFMDPEAWWSRAAPYSWFKNLTMMFPENMDRRGVCVVGIEGNPYLTAPLRQLEERRRGQGWNVTILTERLAWHEAKSLPMRLDKRDPAAGLASSVMEGHPDVQEDPALHVDVAAIDLGHLLRSMRRRLPPRGLVVVKMDIEGAEYELIPRLLADGTLCSSVDLLLMEWHPMVVSDVPPNLEENMGWFLRSGECRTTVWHGCEAE